MLVVVTNDDPVPPTDYSPDGVDLTLIRWMLSLTPAERLEFLEQHVNEIVSIRELNARTYVHSDLCAPCMTVVSNSSWWAG